jgi:transposase
VKAIGSSKVPDRRAPCAAPIAPGTGAGQKKQLPPLVVIQEAGLEGLWIHRVPTENGIESHVVDPASVATSRRRRRAKADKLDGDTLVRTLLAYKRGEPRVCAMVRPQTPEEEDRRRLSRERRVLLKERVQHSNRIKGLLFGQGVTGYEPLGPDRRQRLANSPLCSGPSACIVALTIAGRWLRTRALRRRLGRVGQSTENRESRRPATLACGPCCFNWLGCGYATNPTRF